jgi:hypothetical protein
VVPQSPHLVGRLLLDLRAQPWIVVGIVNAGERKVLPDQQPELVTQVVEGIVLIDTATPDPQHDHLPIASGGQKLAIARLADRSNEHVGR